MVQTLASTFKSFSASPGRRIPRLSSSANAFTFIRTTFTDTVTNKKLLMEAKGGKLICESLFSVLSLDSAYRVLDSVIHFELISVDIDPATEVRRENYED